MQLKLTGVELISFGRTQKKAVVAFKADATETVIGALDIEDIPDTYKNGTPDLELDASEFTIQSKEGALAEWVYTIRCSSLYDISLQRYELTGKRGKGFRHLIFFKLRFDGDLQGCKNLEEYMVNQGSTTGRLTIQCSKKAKQVTVQDAIDEDKKKQGELEGMTS